MTVLVDSSSQRRSLTSYVTTKQPEVLTRTGWKPVAEISLNDKICTLGYDDEIQYVNPTEIHSNPAGGRMYRIKSQQVDLFVTANHQMYVARRYHDFELASAESIAGKYVQYKKNGNWSGELAGPKEFDGATCLAGQGGAGVRIMPSDWLSGSTFMMLLGSFISEGSAFCQPKSGSYGIDICQVKPSFRRRLIDELARRDVKTNETGDKLRIYSKQLYEYFKQFGRQHVRFIPDELFDHAREDLEVSFEWLMWGDGHTHKTGSRPVNYTTTSKRLADDVTIVFTHR